MNNLLERNVCRLCLTTTFDNCLTVTEEIASEISDILFLYLNFSVSDNPVMCTKCEKNLYKAIGFKSSRKMLPSLYSGEDLIRYFNATSESEGANLCYFCINYPTGVRPVPEAEHNVFLFEILQELSTELQMVSTQNPVACNKCFYIIQDILQFTTTCLNVEETIRRYIEIKAVNVIEQVNLNDVQVFLSKSFKWGFNDSVLNGVEYGNDVNEGKTDVNVMNNSNTEENLEEMNENNANEVMNNFSCIQMDEIQLKNEASEEQCDIKVTIENENSITLTVNDIVEKSNVDETKYLKATENCVIENIQQISIKNEEVEIKSENDFVSSKEYKIVQKKKPLACKLCTYTTKYKHSMARHILSHMSNSEVALYQCPKCPFGTKYQSGLNRHMITHQEVEEAKIYKCNKCLFQTKHKYGTIKHALVHKDASEIDTFKCLTCSRGFKRKDQLRKHVLTHMKPILPKYKCDQCNYESIWKDNLTVHHTLKHREASEVTMFKCHLCSHETKLKASLKMHLAKHKKGEKKWHKCKWCTYKSRYRGHVKRHIREEHGNVGCKGYKER